MASELLPEISFSFPAYNEAENLPKLLECVDLAARDQNLRYEVVIVDDGSRDNTPAILQSLQKIYSNLSTYRHATNLGYGAAVRNALGQAKAPLVFFSDADNQFDIREIRKLLEKIKDVDVVVGYRAARNDPAHRSFNSKIGNQIVRKLLGIGIRDINCAFKLFRRKVLEEIHLNELVSTGACINTEIIAKLQRIGSRIIEVPVSHYPRVSGTPTGASPKVIFHSTLELGRVWWSVQKMNQSGLNGNKIR